MFTTLAALLMVVHLSTATIPAAQVPPIQVVDAQVTYRYASSLTIDARVISGDPVHQAFVFIQAEGNDPAIQAAVLGKDGAIHASFDLSSQPLPAFARVYYWVRASTAADREYTSPAFYFDYTDNRYTWQTLDDPLLRLHWTQADLAFGQKALTLARSGMASVQHILSGEVGGPIDIYIYPARADLISALPSASSSLAGFSDPARSLVLVAASSDPADFASLERNLPHELAHVLLLRQTGDAYAALPAWFVEGLAARAELDLDPAMQPVLEEAHKNGTLLPLNTLCTALPKDPSIVYLAYAESASFTRYLSETYGTPAIQRALAVYSGGQGCSSGLISISGVDLAANERRWLRLSYGSLPASQVILNLLPYLLLLGLVIAIPLLTTLDAERVRRRVRRVD